MPFNLPTKAVGIMHFKWQDRGWSEKFVLKPGDQAAQLLAMQRIIAARRWLSPANVIFQYARVSFDQGTGQSAIALASEVPGLADQLTTPVNGDCNDPCTSLLFRYQGENFYNAQRFIRGIPDAIVAANALVPSAENLIPAEWMGDIGDISIVNPNTDNLPFAWQGLSYYKAIRFYNFILKGDTCLAKTGNTIVGNDVVITNTGYDIVGAVYRGVRNHKTGRPSSTPRGRRMAG